MRRPITCQQALTLLNSLWLTRREATELNRHQHKFHGGAEPYRGACIATIQMETKEDTTMLPMNDDTYTENPDEMAPCLICGVPKPNWADCGDSDCPAHHEPLNIREADSRDLADIAVLVYEVMNARLWDADTAAIIADIYKAAGFPFTEPNE